MNEARPIDRIDAPPRFTAEDAAALNRRFEAVPSEKMIEALIGEKLIGRAAVVSSFGAESAVLLHLVARVDRDVPVLFLNTGKHFAETLDYRDRLVERLGLTNLIELEPDPDELAERDESGLRWSYDPDGCCELRKVRPLARALIRFDASFTGRKAYQSRTRANLPRFEIDSSDAHGRLKINPLIDWDPRRIEAYFRAHDLPRHPLVDEGYPSIGCSPCTHKVAPGEDPRSGRWKGWDKTECGIHTSADKPSELPPGYEPFL